MNEIVLDASVVLVILNREPGSDKLTSEMLNAAVSSSVNVAEVHSKLVDRGLHSDDAWAATLSPIREVVDFNSEHARLAGDLIAKTRSHGLSLGDRACLALGLAMQAPVYTADRSWKNLKLGIRIYVVR